MPPKPCRCSAGHRYFESEAKDLDFICDKDGLAIVCPANLASPLGGAKLAAPGAKKAAKRAGPAKKPSKKRRP